MWISTVWLSSGAAHRENNYLTWIYFFCSSTPEWGIWLCFFFCWWIIECNPSNRWRVSWIWRAFKCVALFVFWKKLWRCLMIGKCRVFFLLFCLFFLTWQSYSSMFGVVTDTRGAMYTVYIYRISQHINQIDAILIETFCCYLTIFFHK